MAIKREVYITFILQILTACVNMLVMILRLIIFVSLAVAGVFLMLASVVPKTRK